MVFDVINTLNKTILGVQLITEKDPQPQLFKPKSREDSSDSPLPKGKSSVCPHTIIEQAAGSHSSRLHYAV